MMWMAASVAAQTNTFPASGNVGIGTTSPGALLDIRNSSGQHVVFTNGSSLGLSGAAAIASVNDGGGAYQPLGIWGSTINLFGSSYLNSSSSVWGVPFSSTTAVAPTHYTVSGIGNISALTTFGGSGTSANANGLATVSVYTNTNYTTSSAGNSAGGAFVDLLSNPASITLQSGSGPSWLMHYYASPSAAYALNSQSLLEYGYFSNLAAQPTSGVNAYAFFGNGTAPSYFGGNVGIGTTSPSQLLEVNGTAQIDGSLNIGSAGIVFSNGGGTQTTAWTGVLCGGDYAESVEPFGGKKQYEPGDVLVLTSDRENDVRKSTEPYSTLVAGIYATKPGVIGRRESLSKTSDELPMAMVGIVPTKVTAENGPIHKGDLLVTSSLAGYAMKGTDRTRMLGAVIGKAMDSHDSGRGVIEVLVTLQ
jgi:hypothetical protein